ncbi:MAG: hypothetical protein GX133_09770 [Syntrophomonadaceae bacterium]|nr:hypothetical protein [Syntrophomonadaceae bacterium]
MLEKWGRKWGVDAGGPTGGKYGLYLLVAAVCLGLLALLWPPADNQSLPESPLPVSQTGGIYQARTALVDDLERVLSLVEGAGAVQVSITLSSDGMRSYACNTKTERRVTQEADSMGGDREVTEENQSSDLAISGGDALLVEDRAPEVVGVLVVAEGAADYLIKERLTDATTVLLNVSPHQVRVETRKGAAGQ